MRKTALINAAFAIILNCVSFASDKMIYGDDNRIDFYAMNSSKKSLADSVVSFWENASVTYDSASSSYKLKTVNFGDRLNLCPDERFREQPIGAFCSGSLVGEDLIMTAGHCITDENKCADTKIVFGYAVKSPNSQAVTSMPASEVYTCKKIIKRQLGPEPTPDNPEGIGLGPDYALIRLDRKVSGHKPLKINRAGNLTKGTPLFVIGHPVGLPVKLADDSKVRDTEQDGYFIADLDTFGGNSGSPVFNASTNLIEGILVRGDTDFERSPAGCTVSYRTEQDEGRGEDVTKVSLLAELIPGKNKELSNTQDLEMDTSSVQKETYSFIENSRGIDLRAFSFDK
ncbi:MAG: trypsin-like serine protease [Elusimicrobia bacterium]|nr:trypsin-like serine protease [Elusimicrobiota bacterium]